MRIIIGIYPKRNGKLLLLRNPDNTLIQRMIYPTHRSYDRVINGHYLLGKRIVFSMAAITLKDRFDIDITEVSDETISKLLQEARQPIITQDSR